MREPVRNYMTNSNLVVANLNHSFSQVMEFFAKFPVHHIPIVEGNKVVGIISAKDVIKTFYNHLAKNNFVANLDELNEKNPISKIMTAEPTTLSPDSTMDEAIQVFENHKFHSIPIVEDGEIKGIITTKDIARQVLIKV